MSRIIDVEEVFVTLSSFTVIEEKQRQSEYHHPLYVVEKSI